MVCEWLVLRVCSLLLDMLWVYIIRFMILVCSRCFCVVMLVVVNLV